MVTTNLTVLLYDTAQLYTWTSLKNPVGMLTIDCPPSCPHAAARGSNGLFFEQHYRMIVARDPFMAPVSVPR